VPLSEHEQRLLEQMERALYAEDPKFASSLRSQADRRGGRRRAAIGVVAALVGVALLIAGVATALVVVGIIGFLLMLVGTFLVITIFTAGPAVAAAATGASTAAGGKKPAAAKAPKRGFMDKVEERWRRRHDGEQGR
jgi:hypothetical protein